EGGIECGSERGMAERRGEKGDGHRGAGRAQCSVGSIELDGIRYGLITHCLIASTIRIAPTIVTSQSIVTRQPRGSPAVRRSTGFLNERVPSASARPRRGCPTAARRERATPGTPPAASS